MVEQLPRPNALALIERLKRKHGGSGDISSIRAAADGSAANRRLKVKSTPPTMLLGEIERCPFYRSPSQYECWTPKSSSAYSETGRWHLSPKGRKVSFIPDREAVLRTPSGAAAGKRCRLTPQRGIRGRRADRSGRASVAGWFAERICKVFSGCLENRPDHDRDRLYRFCI